MNRSLLRSCATLASLLLVTSAWAQAPAPTPFRSWLERYNGPANHQDEPSRMALGGDGLFVAGRSYSLASNNDFTLLKYTPQGALAWARHYDGSGHNKDCASSVLPDGEGGAFVCGYSWGGSVWQAALLHYDAAGNRLWVQTTPTPGVIDLELGPRLARTRDGGLRMGMTANGNFLLAAFDGGGAPLWTREMDIVPGESDFLTGLAVDSVGNTIVAGPVGDWFGGYETVMVDAGGNVVWSDRELGENGSTLGPAFVAVDAGDEIVVTGVPESTCGMFETRTWRLTPFGVRLWTRAFPSAFCDTAEAADMALDRDGNTLVLCQSTIAGEGGSFNTTTLKYDPQGNELWHRSITTNPGVDIPIALDTDRAGNVYITGVAGIDVDWYDGMAASYAPDGALRWLWIADDGTSDVPADIAAGPGGEIYLIGFAIFPDTDQDILTVKLQQMVGIAIPR